MFGKGWLNGTQSHLEFIPERRTDFILAVLSEEFGLVGVLVLLMIYVYICGRGLYISTMARDTYSVCWPQPHPDFPGYVIVNASMVAECCPWLGFHCP